MFVLSSFSWFFQFLNAFSIGSQVLRSVCFQHLENKHVHFIHVFDMKSMVLHDVTCVLQVFSVRVFMCSCFLHDLVKHCNLYDTLIPHVHTDFVATSHQDPQEVPVNCPTTSQTTFSPPSSSFHLHVRTDVVKNSGHQERR